jgi:predicted permease
MLQDIRYALRILAQNPAFAAIAVLSLALGIGANTAIFTLVDTVILRNLPVRAPESLVVVAINPADPNTYFNYPDYRYIRDHNRSFNGVLATSGSSPLAMSVPSDPRAQSEITAGANVSGNYFEVLGVVPAVGRLLTPADDQNEGAHPYAVLNWDFWQRRFAADPSVVGRSITLNGSPFTIIGVAQRGFRGTEVGNVSDLYVPITMIGQVNRGVREWNSRHMWWLNVFARLKPGISMAAAIPEVSVLWRQIQAADPEQKPAPSFDAGRDARDRGTLLPGSNGYSNFRNGFAKPLTVLMIVVALVLLIACANVANLLLVRAASRQKEIAIRLAVGAGRNRLVRQLVLETLVVSILGGALGILIAWSGVAALMNLMPRRALPLDLHIAPDLRMLAFSFAVSLLTGLVCGLVPALQSTRPNLVSSLKNETLVAGRARFDLRRVLVVVQVAISLLLLIGAGLFIRSLRNLQNLDPGFSRQHVLLVNVSPRQSGYKGQRLRDYYEQLRARIASIPKVQSVSLSFTTPLAGSRWNSRMAFDEYQWKPKERPVIDANAVSPGYFSTLGIPIIAGRDFREQDNPAFLPDPDPNPGRNPARMPPPSPVAIINETMARRFFAGQNPIGRRFSRSDKFQMDNSFEIVGVVKDANYFNLRKAVDSMFYIPSWRDGASINTISVRTAGDPVQITSSIYREAAKLDPSIPVLQTITLEQQFDNRISQERLITTLCGFFGALALLLAAVGLYGVMAHAVTRRVREIGIRMALGAHAGEVMWLVLRETAWMIGIGALLGVPAALAATRLISSFLYGLTAQDPWSIAGATLVLAVITALAGYIPARRAAKVDPMIALRYE